jgi:hypothetical protein
VRAFLTIGAAALVWIWTAWPGGAGLVSFAAVGITLFAPREDTAYASAKSYIIGTVLAAGLCRSYCFRAATAAVGLRRLLRRPRPRVRTHYVSQNETVAAMQMAEKKVWAHRS